MTNKPTKRTNVPTGHYDSILGDISNVIDTARRSSARSVNSIMTAAYWLIGRRIVESEQAGNIRADYGVALIERLSGDLTAKFGRGFGAVNLSQMKKFYLLWPTNRIFQTPSEKSQALLEPKDHQEILQTSSKKSQASQSEVVLRSTAECFPLPWSAYVRLLSVKNENARRFYETEALSGGWSVRQLDRQINSQFYERTALSRNKAAMLTKGQKTLPEDRVFPEEEIKDPYVLHLTIKKDGTGNFQFGLVQGEMDCRVENADRGSRIEFSWEGQDEMDPASGRGWAVIENGELSGRIFIHLGDDSAFRARKTRKGGFHE